MKRQKRYNWEEIGKFVQEHANRNGKFTSISAMAKFLNIPHSTVYDAYLAGKLPNEVVDWSLNVSGAEVNRKPEAVKSEKVEYKEEGNEAYARFVSAEPLSKEDLIALANIDMDVWECTNFRVNAWTTTGKVVDKDLLFESGAISGTIKSHGLQSKYNWQSEAKFTRKKRIPVTLVLQPVEISFKNNTGAKRSKRVGDKVLYMTDPQFGFKRDFYSGDLIPFHLRKTLSALLQISFQIQPEYIVWGGDQFDLPDMTGFFKDPSTMYHTQLSAFELAWLMAQFRKTTDDQIVLEGNHEKRLRTALGRNFSSAYELRPVHEIEGSPMMSVERLVGFDKFDTEWIGGYPDNYVDIGEARFSHGTIARAGSGTTTSSIAKSALMSKFYGHCHRRELVSKWVEDSKKTIWLGTPGCLCDRRFVPGARNDANWQVGAFLISMDDYGDVEDVEIISGSETGPTFFRGEKYDGEDYTEQFMDEIPAEWRKRF